MEELFNRLEEELSKQGLFARRIDLDKCLEILHRLRKDYEFAINEANRIIQSKNEILANADMVAKNVIKDAGKQAYSESSGRYVYATRQASAQTLDHAAEAGEEIFEKTKSHIDNLFHEIEDYLMSMVELVRKNREELKALKLKVR